MKGTRFSTSTRRIGTFVSFALFGLIVGFIISSNLGIENIAVTQPRDGNNTINAQFARSTAAAQSIYPLNHEGKSPFVNVVQKVRDAVVNIRAERIEEMTPYQQRWLRFWGYPDDERQEVSMGTGFFFRTDGYILTNHHVIAGARKITVTLADYSRVDARIVGEDPATDLAVIRINGDGYPWIELGDSDSIQVGEWVMAIGNPFPSQGLDRTVTVGVVSAKGRRGLNFGEDSPEFQDYIQTDAAINPGNSGGPLVSLEGYVVGINSAIASSSGQSAGIGFAIPANLVRSILPDLITGGRVERGWLGVTMSDLDPVQAEANGLNAARGVLIREVQPDSPADQGGLERGDIIVKFDGTKVDDMNHFRYLVAGARSGSHVNMELYRRGKPMNVSVTLGDRDLGLSQLSPQEFAQEQDRYTKPTKATEMWFGMAVETATEELAERYGVEYRDGVIVTYVEPGSLADIEGINPGTILIEIDHKDVHSASEFFTLKKELDGRERAIALIGYDIRGNIRYYAIKPQS